ncbi:hypothetical protein SEA_GODONK_15 [Gordonia phage GodonK]|uniref:Uncharacterized protein n=2 Tax=Gordonia phage GodonK TaxID=2562192 RepID=A0A4D6E2A3_9CAUD|nr:hypothetical protein HOV33_gp015 [Gordonia phage GodonK]QBZ72634.1 hypothetical protein SEA_GODONK_15 [Gordonia phage GodonK]
MRWGLIWLYQIEKRSTPRTKGTTMNAITTNNVNAIIAQAVVADAIDEAAARINDRIDAGLPVGPNSNRASKNVARVAVHVERHRELIAFKQGTYAMSDAFDAQITRIQRAAAKALCYGATEDRVRNAVLLGLANARQRIAFAPAPKVSLVKAATPTFQLG